MNTTDDQTEKEGAKEGVPANEENAQENEETHTGSDVRPILDSVESSTKDSSPTDTDHIEENQTLNNNTMAEEKTPAAAAPEKKEKTEKKTTPEKKTPDAVVKKDYTALIAAIVTLILVVGVYAWQNYRKRKDDENTLDVPHKESDYETEFDRNGYIRNN